MRIVTFLALCIGVACIAAAIGAVSVPAGLVAAGLGLSACAVFVDDGTDA